ncbi:universal stress protein [Isachenkonia alkalipeptolytica]|uniref:Universal stress protein n=1 Tax=Isachenkonia alkalipeptolytica TaxID=2565777 RepID=A0AA44BEZ8_9CLOT|nr:universal stress protein [Isachenkonia alkalipeptolytica]NBG88695.1 universal stress protein [Isachenkonia alkalipeptolytica]
MLLEKVLLCTDFSPPAEKLVKCIAELQKSGLREVVVLHVIDIDSGEAQDEALQQKNEEKLAKIEREMEEMGLQAKGIITSGVPSVEIARAAEEEAVSLILLGSHGKGYIKSRYLGSTTFDVLRMTETPLLIEKYLGIEEGKMEPYCTQKFSKVLIPVDFSEHSIEMMEKIKETKGIQGVILVSVVEKSENQQELENSKKEWKERLAIMEEEFLYHGYEVQSHVREGTASRNIMEVAEEEGATLIALATRGTGAIEKLLIGSTIDAVARQSKNPVLIFPSR